MIAPIRSGSRIQWTRWRRISQVAVALLYLVLPLVNVAGHHQVNGTLAALKIGPIELVEPGGALSAIVAGRHIGATLLIGILPILLLALVAGPVFCSWVCPWGLISELVDKFRSPAGKHRWAADAWIAVRRIRLGSFVLCLAVSAALAIPLIAIFSPPRLITALALEAIALKTIAPATSVLLVLLLVFELLGPRRLWCRAICPVGALSNFLRAPFTLRVITDPAKCYCPPTGLCYVQCPWGVDPRRAVRFDGCTNCMRCLEACPSGALKSNINALTWIRDLFTNPRPQL